MSSHLAHIHLFTPLAHSPYIVGFLGACFSEGKITMALEYMNRGSLDQAVKKYGPLSEHVLRSILRQVVAGLDHLHSNHLVHRDISKLHHMHEWHVT